MSDFENKISKLIENKNGDISRLNELLERVKANKTIYNSDIRYIESRLESKTNENNKKSLAPIDTTPSKTKENKTLETKGYSNNQDSYAISYSNNYDEDVKIHTSNCRHTRNASQAGPIKWKFANSLREARSITTDLSREYGYWRFSQCCSKYTPETFFLCSDCRRYSEDFDNTQKLHNRGIRIPGILLMVLPFLLMITNILPRLAGFNALLMVIGLIILLIENHKAPHVCKNCLSRNWGRF